MGDVYVMVYNLSKFCLHNMSIATCIWTYVMQVFEAFGQPARIHAGSIYGH